MRKPNRSYATALHLYLSGLQVQMQLPEDPNAISVMRLRITELFATRELKNSAQSHLEEARKLSMYASNHAIRSK